MRVEDTTGRQVIVQPVKDKVMYLAFWATWCGPCIGKIPYQDSLMQRLKDDTSIIFVNVCVDKPENKQQWLNIIRKKNYQGYNVFLDKDAAEVDSLRLIDEGYPFHLVVGKNGKVLGCDIFSDEELFVSYALLQAQGGKTVNESIRNMVRQSKRMRHHDDAETKAL
jgi:thiol-disulfide isomerase/thioredoxin